MPRSMGGMNSRVLRGRRERFIALFGESSKSKAYKLAKKYQLVDVGGVAHVFTRAGDDTLAPGVEEGGVGLEAQPPTDRC